MGGGGKTAGFGRAAAGSSFNGTFLVDVSAVSASGLKSIMTVPLNLGGSDTLPFSVSRPRIISSVMVTASTSDVARWRNGG
jgi:hypothetical protein